MSTKTWTATLDFENADDAIAIVNGSVKLRHQGAADGSGFSSLYPIEAQYKQGWEAVKTGATASFISYPGGGPKLQLSMQAVNGGKQRYIRPFGTNVTIGKADTFEVKAKFQITSSIAFQRFFLGLFNTANNVITNSIMVSITDDGSTTKTLYVYDSGGTSDTGNFDSNITTGSGNDIEITIAGNGTTITATAVHAGGTSTATVNVADVAGTVTCDFFGVCNLDTTTAADVQTLLIEEFSGTSLTWTPFHQGAKDSHFWNDIDFPDISGETRNGWTMTNSGGATSTVAFAGGTLNITGKRENSDSKKFHYWRSANASILKSSTFDEGMKFQQDSVATGAGLVWGFFASGNDAYNANSINFQVTGDGTPYLYIADSASTVYNDGGSASDIVDDTDFWARLRGDGTDITLDIYSTLNLYDAASTGDVAALSVAVSSVTGTVTCDRFGFHNLNAAGGTATQVWNAEWLEGDSETWYPATTARCVDYDYSGPEQQQTDWSTFTPTVTGTVVYNIRRKLSSTASFTETTATNTAAEIQAIMDENLYGVGFKLNLTANQASCSVSAISIDHIDDTLAPGGLDFLKVHADPATDKWYVAFEDATDAGGAGLAFNECRFTEDNRVTWKYLGWDSANHNLEIVSATATFAQFRNPITTDVADKYDYAFTLDASDLSISAEEIIIQMRGVDKAANEGGWTDAENFVPSAGEGAYVGASSMECLRAIASTS